MATSPFANRHVRRQWTAFGILLALSAVMLAGSGTGAAHEVQAAFGFAMRPIEQRINEAADTVASYWGAFASIDSLRRQNEDLRNENETLRQQLARMPAISHLNDDWTAVTQTRESVPYKTTPARVLVRDIGETAKTVVVDQGSSAGIKVDNIVIAAGGALVGKVVWVSPATSQIQLINDPGSVVTGLEQSSGATGEVKGQIGGLLQMVNIDATFTVRKDQQIVTLGQSLSSPPIRSLYPPGLLIGTIIDISRDANAVVQTATVLPAADLARVNFVLVITNYQGGLDVATPSGSPGPNPSASATPSATPSPPKPSPTKKR